MVTIRSAHTLARALLCCAVAAGLLLPSAASGAEVKPPMAWKVVDVPTTDEGCIKMLLRTWPRVPGESMVWMLNQHRTSKEPARFVVKSPFDDVIRGSDGKVIDRAPKGMHQYTMATIGGRDCAEAERRIKAHMADYRAWTEVYTSADHLIQGTVELDCAKRASCPRDNGIEGIKVTAGGSSTTTVAGGHYLMRVKRGVHTVRAENDLLEITTKPKRVDVRKRTTGTADFKACGIRGLAATRAVGGNKWVGGGEDRGNYFEISWRPSSQELAISWGSVPRCANGLGKPKVVVRSQLVRPGQAGHGLTVGESEVGFMYPISAPQLPNSVHGTLRADRTGVVTANLHEGACTYGISNLKLKVQ